MKVSDKEVLGTLKIPMTQKYTQLINKVNVVKNQQTQKLPQLQINGASESRELSSKLKLSSEKIIKVENSKISVLNECSSNEVKEEVRKIPIYKENWEDNNIFDVK